MTATVTSIPASSCGHRQIVFDVGTMSVHLSDVQNAKPETFAELKEAVIVILRHQYLTRRAAGNVETIATLGTYAAPTAGKCRFKQVDATNHPGLYEFQFADARYSVASSKRLVISASGAANLLNADYEIELVGYNPFDAVRLGLTALPNAAADAAGGLPISDAGGLDLDTLLARLDATITSRLAPAGTLALCTLTTTTTTLTNAPPDSSGVTTLLARLGAFTGTGWNTVLGLLRALLRKDVGVTLPTDIGGTFDNTTDSVEAIRDTAPLGTAMRGTDDAALAATALSTATWTGTKAGYLDEAVSTRATPAQVNTEVVDALGTDVIAEMAQGIPPATPTFKQALMYLYMTLRNKLTVTATEKAIYDDAGVKVAKKALSDDATTYTEAEMISGV